MNIVRLFTLDGASMPTLRFCPHEQDIEHNGETYTAIAMQIDGLDVRADGKAQSPTLSIANQLDGVQGAISALCLRYYDFAGARLSVLTLIDNEPFEQTWYVEQKTQENHASVTFELSNPVDFGGKKIPSREISSFCTWAVRGRYRGVECGYKGARYTIDGKRTDDPQLDKCGGCLADCKLRFGDNPLPFGGFVGANLE